MTEKVPKKDPICNQNGETVQPNLPTDPTPKPGPCPPDGGGREEPPQAAGFIAINPKQPVGGGAVQSGALQAPSGELDGKKEDPFDPRKLALGQDFVTMVGTKKEVMRVPIQRPTSQVFFSPHPDPKWRIQVAVIELREDRENYLVVPALLEELQSEWVPKTLVACQTRQGAHFFWPIRLPGQDGRIDTWNEAAMRIASTYGNRWIRLMSNKDVGAYDVVEPITPFPAPTWPDSPDELMAKAFRDRVIDTLDHPVVKRLRGLA
jgi:hypothetical protein